MAALGDLYRTLQALRPEDDEEVRTITRMLSIEITASQPIRPEAQKTERVENRIDGSRKETRTTRTAPQPYVPFSLTPIGTSTDDRPSWLANATPLPVERTRYRAPKLPFEPLFPQNKVRALLATMLATPVEEGPLDVPRLISAIARAEPLLRLYRQRSLTVRRGVQLLVDRGESMSLFGRDARWLTKELQNVIGIPRVELRLFADCPSRGTGTPDTDEWMPYQPPPIGTPILLLTDFGIGATPAARAASTEWEQFFGAARAAACPVFAMIPYATGRWPADVASYISALVWDRETTVQAARRAAAAARRRKAT